MWVNERYIKDLILDTVEESKMKSKRQGSKVEARMRVLNT